LLSIFKSNRCGHDARSHFTFHSQVRFHYKKYSARSICIALFAYSVLINAPYYFLNYPAMMKVYLNETTTLSYYFASKTQFTETIFGSIVQYSQFFLREILSLILVLTFNVIVLLKRYLVHRSKVFNMTRNSNKTTVQSKQIAANSVSNSQSIDTKIASKRLNDANTQENQTRRDLGASTSVNSSMKISRADRSATLMAIILSIFSVIEHSWIILIHIFFSNCNKIKK
jgi:hypothetical protein